MSCLAITDVTCREGTSEQVLELFGQMIPAARKAVGSEQIQIFRNQDDPNNMTWVEHWQHREQHEAHLKHLEEEGILDSLLPLLTEPPTIRHFDESQL